MQLKIFGSKFAIFLAGPNVAHRVGLLEAGLGAEGGGGGDDHQPRGAGQEEVLPVLARYRVGGLRPGVSHCAGGNCPGIATTQLWPLIISPHLPI